LLKNDHFLPKKPDKPIFHKNLFNFFVQFLGTMFENTLVIDDTLHKSLFNLPFSAIFFGMFYESRNDVNYLFQTIIPYLESLHSFGMQDYKFIEVNPFGNLIDVLFDDPWYVKLIAPCST